MNTPDKNIGGLGAAGCGFEYDLPQYKCNHLQNNLFGFTCNKYKIDLEIHKLGHPVRCQACCNHQ